jgi:hypothetical protein
MIEFKGSHFERDVILWAVRWYVAYGIVQRFGRSQNGIDIIGRPFTGLGTANGVGFAEDRPLCCGHRPSLVIAETV